MGRRRGPRTFLWLLILMPGCAYVNEPLNKVDLPLQQRVGNHTRTEIEWIVPGTGRNDDGIFVGLALSGGGSRSANFSAACMLQLQQFGILDKVDYISSVSGGSLPGAFYCLMGPEWNPADLQNRLSHAFASEVIISVLMPWNMIALMVSSWDRSDILANSFQAVLYSRDGRALTYNDLRSDRPRLLINATDLQSGRRFVFCNDSFDTLNSDLSKYPMAHAVAASAAVPVLLHHVTLRDHSTIFKRYQHVLDGGINDNLGVTSLLEAYTRQIQRAAELRVADPYPKGLILIVVDARTNFDTQLDEEPDVGLFDSLAAGAGLSTTALLNRVSSATLAQLIVEYSPSTTTAQTIRDQIRQLERTGSLVTSDRQGKPVRVAHIALSHLDDVSDLPFASFGQRVNSITTYFNIGKDEVYHLYNAAELLMKSEDLKQPLADIARELNVGPTTSGR